MTYTANKTGNWRRTIAFVRESLRDNKTDYTVGPLDRALGLLAIPMMLEMSMESVFAAVDIAFVSRLGTDAIAAVGITEAIVTVLYAVAIGLGMGVTAMVSRRIGSKQPEAAASTAGQALWIGAGLSIVIGISGVIYAEDMLHLMGATNSVVETGKGFIAVSLGGSVSILYLFLLNAVFRGAGDASVALRSLWLANGINIVLDPCLIFGIGPFPELGVTGAAIATTIGRSVGVVYQLWYLFGGRGRLAFQRRHLRIVPSRIARLVVISLGGIGQFLVATSSWIMLMRIVSLYGSGAIAAYTIGLRMLELVWLPSWGLGNAAATLVGQNLGSGNADRAEKSTWLAARYNAILMTFVGIIVLLLAPGVADLFSNDVDVVRHTTHCLRILAVGCPMYAVGMIVTQALNGAGDTLTPTGLNMICFWFIQLPLAYWLATELLGGPNGVFLAIMLSESLLTVLSVIVFKRGAWKYKNV
jgi:putative MATE family efflux protein